MHSRIFHIMFLCTHKDMHARVYALTSGTPSSASSFTWAVSRCFGPNPSCRPASPQRGSDSAFPLNQMKKVKRRTWLPEPEGSAGTPRTSRIFAVIQHHKGATSAQEIITTSTRRDSSLTKTQREQRVQNNNDAFVLQSSARCFKDFTKQWEREAHCKQYINNQCGN